MVQSVTTPSKGKRTPEARSVTGNRPKCSGKLPTLMDSATHPGFTQLYDAVMALPERYFLGDHRAFLAEGVSGRVLDVGSGTGAQFPAFADQASIPAVEAVEPDRAMRQRSRERADALGLRADVVDARAESLPYDDDSFDAVVASLVFCTISDPEAALDEVARVLAPGGEFRFLEHVRGTGGIGIAHDLLAPCWHPVAGGCTLNRQTGDLFRRDDRFELLAYDRFESGLARGIPLIRGRLQRRRGSSVLSWVTLGGR
jgi:SAM-dependent methyltransferase